MQNQNAWTYGPKGLPVETGAPHNEPTLVMRPVRASARWRRVLLRVLLGFGALLLLLIGSGVFFWFNPTALGVASEPFLAPQPGTIPWNGTDAINILAMGVDQRVPGERTHSDTMIVITVDPVHRHVRLVSIPRDLAVDVPGYSALGKINEGYYLGGPRYSSYVVEHALGIPINYYMVLKFSSFVRLIDALGGANVTVDQAINDPTYPALVGNGYDPFVLSAGPHHMDGATALRYVRERHAFTNQDETRVQHQQQVIAAIKSQLFSLHTLFHLPSIVEALRATVNTDLPDNLLPVMGLQILRERNIEHIYFNDTNHMVYQCVGYDQGADLCPYPAFWTAIKTLFADPKLAAEAATVWVQNGSSIFAKEKQVAATLTTCHFTVVGSGPADSNNHAHTAVIINSARTPAPYTTRLLRQMFGARLLTRNMPAIPAQIVLLLGNDAPHYQS